MSGRPVRAPGSGPRDRPGQGAGPAPRRAIWYFDFISPYAYLQCRQLHRLPPGLALEFRPVLFAGLLEAWGQLGPAEIPQKKIHTMLTVQWRARKAGLPFKPPPRHPFNPLPLLRLAVAQGSPSAIVETIFDHVWAEGNDGQDPQSLSRLARRLGLGEALPQADQASKDGLRANTREAADHGVFGVPSFVIDGRVFWGDDMFDLMLDWLHDPAVLDNAEARRIAALPAAAERPRAPASGRTCQTSQAPPES